MKQLRHHVDELQILVSTPMEEGRGWAPGWSDLPVTVQRTLTLHQVVHHPAGFSERNAVHFPIDTLWQLEKFCPDVIITGEFGLRSVLASLYCLRHRETGLVLWATLSERSEVGRGRSRKLLRRFLVRQADVIIVNGASGGRYMAGLGAASNRVVQIPYTTDVTAFSGISTRPPEFAHRILHVGQLSERKGVIGFLEELARYATSYDGQLEMWFVGDGSLRPALESIKRPTNLHIRVLGHVPYHELPQIYMRAGILAFPTLSDEWGLVVNEAMAAGLPVLGSIHSQAVEELIQDNLTGWRFDPCDPVGTNRAISRALSASPKTLDGMRSRAMATVRAITPERMSLLMIEACQLALRLSVRSARTIASS